MLLAEVIGSDAPAVEVTALAYDNRLVTPGTLFFCVPGFTRDGHDYADDAIARGAVALVVQRPLGTARARGPRRRRARRDGARRRRAGRRPHRAADHGRDHGHQRQDDVGLPRARRCSRPGVARTGLLGTVTAIVGGEQHAVARTTPEAIDLQRTFADMLAAGDDAVVMEVSSHALVPAPRRRHPLVGGRSSPTSRRTTSTSTPTWRTTSWPSAGCSRPGPSSRSSTSTTPTARAWPATSRRRSASASTPPTPRCARRPSRATRAARPSRSTGWRCARRCRAASTSSTRWARWWSRASWGSTTRRSRAALRGAPSACPGASSPSTRASPSRSSSTTRTSPTPWRPCCARPAG